MSVTPSSSPSYYFRGQAFIDPTNEEAAKEASKVSTGTALAGAGAGVGGLGAAFAVVQHLRKPKTPTNNNDTVDNNNDDDNSKRNMSDNSNSSDENNRKTSDESRNNEDDEFRRREGEDNNYRREEGGENYRREERESENSVVIKIKKPIQSTKLELSPEDFKQITEMLRLNKKTFKIL
jgi:hypothetical protein